jgi:hypothetical protein
MASERMWVTAAAAGGCAHNAYSDGGNFTFCRYERFGSSVASSGKNFAGELPLLLVLF